MKILLYTHSDYFWVWKYWHKQTDKFLSNKFKLINKNRDKIKTIKKLRKKRLKESLSFLGNMIDNSYLILAITNNIERID